MVTRLPSFANELVELLGNDEAWSLDGMRHMVIHCGGLELKWDDTDEEVYVLNPVVHHFWWWERRKISEAVLHLLAVKMRKAAVAQSEINAAVARINGEGCFQVDAQ